jgi:hypothetical protein
MGGAVSVAGLWVFIRQLGPLMVMTSQWWRKRKRAGSGDLGACSLGTRTLIAFAGSPVAGFAGSGRASSCRELTLSGGVEDGFDQQFHVAVIDAGDGVAEDDGCLAGEAGGQGEHSAFPA